MIALFAILGIVCLFLAGLRVGAARVDLCWLGIAFLALAAFWGPVHGTLG